MCWLRAYADVHDVNLARRWRIFDISLYRVVQLPRNVNIALLLHDFVKLAASFCVQ